MNLTCGEFWSDIGTERLKGDFLGSRDNLDPQVPGVILCITAGTFPTTSSHAGSRPSNYDRQLSVQT